MSAICGVLHMDGKPGICQALQSMLAALAHRGPDGSGHWSRGPVGLGVQFMWTTPESIGETQPFYDSQAGMAIVADARLDNRSELASRLSIAAHDLPGLPDSFFLLKAYQRWGVDSPKYLLGDFAYAIWDDKKQECICVTDHLGMRPFFYWYKDQRFVFATEIRGIHAVSYTERAPNLKRIACLGLLPRALPLSETFFADVFALPVATVMTVGAAGIRQWQYWTPEIPPPLRFKQEADYIEAFQNIFSQAIAARLRSAFPVTALLSGGLDSSAICGMAARLEAKAGKRLQAFAAVLPPGYTGAVTDEREYIDELQSSEGLDIEYITDPWRGPFDNLKRLVWSGESPLYTSRHYLYTAFADAAARHKARIILDGVGGEFGPSFHGEGFYAELLLRGEWLQLYRELAARSELEQRSVWGLFKGEVVKPLLPQAWLSRWKPRFDLEQLYISSPLRRRFVEQQLGNALEQYRQRAAAAGQVFPSTAHNLLSRLKPRRTTSGNNGFAGYEQVEMSFPYYDRRVLEFCLALPANMKVRNGYKRYMIRAGMKGILSHKLRYRMSKEPFSPDYHERYNRQKQHIAGLLDKIKSNPLLEEVVDEEKLRHMLAYTMQTNRCDTPAEFAAMHAVPQGVYLISFLESFS